MAYEGRIKGPRYEIARGAEGFPSAFERIPQPPGSLYVIGSVEALREGLAVVGARKMTPYGRSATKLFAGRAAHLGVPIISGGAMGCDSMAHESALEAGGVTVAFLGGGCDMPYPAGNRGLFQRIVDGGGAIASEYPWAFPPQRFGFRMRNRLIAGLARATLIAEAGMPSGTFTTADEALAANKDVLAVPGSIFSPTSKGANALIAQGAMPLVDTEGFDAVLARLFPDIVGTAASARQLALYLGKPMCEGGEDAEAQAADPLLVALRADPLRLDQLVSLFASGEGDELVGSVGKLMGHLVKLEAAGRVSRFPDGRYGAV